MSFAIKAVPDCQAHAPPGFSLAARALHEFYGGAEADGMSLAALALMLGADRGKKAMLWVRHEALASETGTPHPAGLVELGFDPTFLLLVRARDVSSALQAGLEGARCKALGAVIIEIRGEARVYDLTASRRLALAAKSSGVPVFLLRIGAMVVASAAETRWLARSASSRALAAKAPGHPAFHLTLLRARNGQEGLQHHLEWNRDAQRLESRFADRETGYGTRPDDGPSPPLSRIVVPVSLNRSRPARDEPLHAQRAG
jgi:protein ImuA